MVVLHANRGGLIDMATYTNGTRVDPYTWAGLQSPLYPRYSTHARGESWIGSLVANKHDGSGLVYMRNRYLNPQTGQFTQTDPIGLAGGLNLYGYANGDPVNFSDPFGLCVPWPHCALAAGRLGAAAGTVIGAGVGVWGGGVGAIPGAVAGNRVGWVVGAGIATVGALSIALESRRFPKADRDAADETNRAENEGQLTCVHCGQSLTDEAGHGNSREHDHRDPYAQGGPSTGENLDTTCRTCNRDKGNRTPQQWDDRWYTRPAP
jgi:RHS repeat-associated protein